MARRRRRSLGASEEVHRERAKSSLREIKRLRGHLKAQLREPPDCVHAFHLATTLAEQVGAHLIDRYESSGKMRGGQGLRALISKFEKVCVIHPKSIARARRIHAVWR